MTPSKTTAAILAIDAGRAAGVRAALEDAGVEVALETDSEPAVTGLEPAPDVVVVACDDGATRRAALIRRLRRGTGSRVIAIGDHRRRHEVRSAIAAGASGFVFDTELAALGGTIAAACAGQVAIPWAMRRQVDRPALSYREKQILGLVVMGFMNCEIAERLFLAESTVKSHLSAAFAKLGVRSRNEAVELILDAEEGMGRGILAITGGEAGRIAAPDAA